MIWKHNSVASSACQIITVLEKRGRGFAASLGQTPLWDSA